MIFLLLILKNSLESATWPPIKTDCPDYWDVSLNLTTGEKMCINNSTANKCKRNYPKTDTTPGWCDTGLSRNKIITAIGGLSREEDINCAKKLWAKYEGVTWDGITNNKRLCDDSTFY